MSTTPTLHELQSHCLVRIVDDDAGVRDSYRFLLEGEGWMTRCYESAEMFLKGDNPDIPGCLLLDVRMGGMSGPELHTLLLQANSTHGVVFVSAHGTIADAVKAVKRGAVDFLTKPVPEDVLIETVAGAAAKSWSAARHSEGEKLFATLTEREREVVLAVANGRLNKQIAAELDISERTVQVHRANAQRKLGARTSGELVKLVVELGKLS